MNTVRKCQGVSQKPIGCGNIAFECSERHVEIDSPSIVDDLSGARFDLIGIVSMIRGAREKQRTSSNISGGSPRSSRLRSADNWTSLLSSSKVDGRPHVSKDFRCFSGISLPRLSA